MKFAVWRNQMLLVTDNFLPSTNRWWQVPYFWAGIKMYDLVAGSQRLKPSYFLSKEKALEAFPQLKEENLKGGLVYYDGARKD